MVTAILSPHLDDAVLSCWHLLTEPRDVTVINVFAGVPSRKAAAWWDQHTGAIDSAERMRERIAEDRRSLALAGRAPVNLDFLDDQYRDTEQALAPVTAQIARSLIPGAHVYAPGAFAGHPDHLLVRAAALELRREGFPVTLYADLPHATVHGWPTWVRRSNNSAAKDLAAGFWDRSLAATGISPLAMTPLVHGLEADAYARKLAAMRAYGTQAQALADVLGRPLSDPDTFGYEVVWALPQAATVSRARAGNDAMRRL
jgi:LmbE family N-acetylglucosaminyl deacetylase